MEGWASPALEFIAYRAEGTVEAGEAGVQLTLSFSMTSKSDALSFPGRRNRINPLTEGASVAVHPSVPRSIETTAWSLPKVGPLLPIICSVDSLCLEQL